MPPDNSGPSQTSSTTGLSAAEAAARLKQYGSNAVRPRQVHPIRSFALKLWGPVPWMLEASLILELVLGKSAEGSIIAALLFVNASLSFQQERRAQGALELLRRRLQVTAHVLRDAAWRVVSADELAPGDVVHLRMGDLVPGDVEILEGTLSIDQSTLTGESLPVERTSHETIYSASMVMRGEATGRVTATGVSTYFGKTAELVRAAREPGRIDTVIYAIVRYLAVIDAVFAAAILIYTLVMHDPLLEILPFILILLVTAVPVALPAAFTVTTALAALELTARGVLVARLSAIESAAAMDVLCTDKAGTLTQNRLQLTSITPFSPCDERRLLALAALASDRATQDPFDLSILERAPPDDALGERLTFVPFDPATKRSKRRSILRTVPARSAS